MDTSVFTDEPRGPAEVMAGEIGEGLIEPQTGPRPKREGCACVTDHRPTVVGTDFHHVVPLAWGGPDTLDNIIELCPTTHRSLHDLLRWVVKEQKWPPREVLYRFPRFVRALGARAVRDAGGIPQRNAVPLSYGGTR